MEAVFVKLLNLSIQASLLIVVIMLLRVMLRKSPKWVRCLLWGLVAVRLVFPFSIESSYSLAPSSELVEINTYAKNDTDVMTQAQAFDYDGYEEHIYHVEDTVVTKNRSIEPVKLLSLVWLIGMIGLALYAIASYLNIWKCIRLSINTQENIYLCDRIASPFIFGILRPCIYLPSQITEEQKESVIAHEKAHLKRLDHLWKPLGYLLLMIYWFNPLCWVAYFLLCKDIELACDERVIKHMSMEQKKCYSKVLLSFSESGKMMTACPLAFGEVGVKERVKSILDYKKPAFWIVAVAIISILATSFFFLTSPQQSTYELTFRIPPGCVDQVIYSEEEISPVKNKEVSFLVGQDVGDTLISISCVEGMVEKNDDASYITPGMETKLKAQKGAWYRVGIRAWNDTAQEKTVHVRVKNVEVRIASKAEASLENVQAKETVVESSPTIDVSASTGAADGADTNEQTSFVYYSLPYEEKDGHYIVDGDMVYRYKKVLTGKDATAEYPTQFTVLTNEEDVTWEKVWKSLISSSSADWLNGTLIIKMKGLEQSIPDSCWPTVSYTISSSYGVQPDRSFLDHMNIAGEEGDLVFAVTDGVVVRQEYDKEDGNVITLDIGNKTLVTYGHLKECLVSEGDSVSKGQVIATLGKTGMATGPNLM